jgi:hypothetical protein
MTVRTYIYDLITNDSVLNALGITEDSTFTTHTIDTPAVRPLCILRWQATNRGIDSADPSPVNQRILMVWVHDDRNRGEYDRIDAALKRLRTLLENVVGVNVGEGGAWLSGIRWEGDTDDLDDPDLRTLTRSAQFRLTGSGV